MPLQAGTQWDALAHVYYEDRLYNGFPSASVTSNGAQYCSIDKMTAGILSRGVLLDIARLRGKRWLDRGETITAADLADAAAAHGVAVRSGDIILVRTGWWQKYATERDGRNWWDGEPGVDHTTLSWFHKHEIAAVASDNWGVEVATEPASDRSRPVHLIALRDMGMPLGEIWDLEGLSAACAELNQYEFLLTAPPLRVTAAVGSPVNPLAVL
jgi:kynurenine formamidase